MRRLAFLALSLAACGSPPQPTTGPETAPSPRPVDTAAAPHPTSTARPSPNPAPARPAPEVRTKSHLDWELSLEKPTLSIAVGKRRVAVLTGTTPGRPTSTYMRDAQVWRELPLGSLAPGDGETDHLRIYFGRDDRPRVMGYRQKGVVQSQRYYRWKGNWRGKPGEIGRLDADPSAALFGILGHDDPEVVCKLDDICIIKRLTGWSMVPVPDRIHEVEIANKSAFAVADGSALRIDDGDQAWKKLSPEVPWTSAPTALWPVDEGSVWVTDGNELFHLDDEGWHTSASPIERPRKLWGRAADDVWLAGKGGLAHFDGRFWSRLESPKGDFRDVNGNENDVWVAGRNGVWRGR